MMKSFLKKIAFVLLTGFLLSSSCRQVTEQGDLTTDQEYVTAVVTAMHAEDGCGYIFSVEEEGTTKLYDPIELANEFKQEGMRVSVKFHTSRIQQKTCFSATPVVVDDIKVISKKAIGVVHLTEEGCGVYIDAYPTTTTRMSFYPINLEEKFKKEGQKIRFSYSISRAMQPEGCTVDHSVNVFEVEGIE